MLLAIDSEHKIFFIKELESYLRANPNRSKLASVISLVFVGVAGCCTGLALSFPGTPQALLQSCITFGAFSFIIEGINNHQLTLALTSHMNVNNRKYEGEEQQITETSGYNHSQNISHHIKSKPLIP
ncbi:hypothetical protein RND71_029091 [Anisodus tanguticus]|uniref:Uncharacterized protein n=1 Tax=Anisodus tanguticus TaxID=243964 RepID=A0AAE1UYG4_9SOLA|nr:hypothetical protein RND71_029091 [Anisodus tanguticus]